MNGVEAYSNNIEKMIKHKLNDYPQLTGYVNYLSNIGSLTTNYNYLIHVIKFLNKTNKSVGELELDDYTLYLSSLKNKTNGYQRCAYFALKRYGEYLLYSGKFD